MPFSFYFRDNEIQIVYFCCSEEISFAHRCRDDPVQAAKEKIRP